MDDLDALVTYWESVRAKARIGRIAVVTGPGALASVPPVAFAFGDGPELADELLGLVLAGVKTGTSTAVAELGEEAPPREGELAIVLDGAGHPRALIRTTSVVQCAFRDVTPDFAASEGEGDRSLAYWRREHERYWRRVLGDERFSEDIEVLCETFEVLDPEVA